MIQQSNAGLNGFHLKLIAIIAMLIDHIAWAFFPFAEYPAIATVCHTIGKLTFPIMAFFIVEGYIHTRNLKKYMGRMLLFALISLFPFVWLFGNWAYHNVLFTMLLGLCAIYIMEKPSLKRPLRVLAILGLCIVNLFTDWGGLGVPYIVLMYSFRQKTGVKRVLAPILIMTAAAIALMALNNSAVYFTLGELPFYQILEGLTFVGMLGVIPLIANYNGQRGRNLKYLFYAFYPAHLLVLAAIKELFFK